MLTPDTLRAAFEAGLPYDAYVETASEANRASWRAFHDRAGLTEAERSLIASFGRTIRAVVLSGTWCGDCVQQLPFLAHIEAANPDRIGVRYLDRDEHIDLAERVRICSGTRVPVVIFANEDFDFISLFGDRSLARYRALAARQLGASCPLPGAPVPPDEIAATRADWVGEAERVHLLCRLSTKLRGRYGD